MSLSVVVAPKLRRRVPRVVGRRLEARLRRAASVLGVSRPARDGLSVRLVDDDEMAALHLRHMGLRGPTDVMSFPAAEVPTPDADDPLLGDIIIDWDAVMRQAPTRTLAGFVEEATALAVHGLVHLLGHDHATRSEARAMLRLERRASRAAGLGPVRRPYGGGH